MANTLYLPHDVRRQADGALVFRTPYDRSGHVFHNVPAALVEQTSLGAGHGFVYNFTGSNFPQSPAVAVGTPQYAGGWVVSAAGTGAASWLVAGDGGLAVTPGSTDEDNTTATTTGEPFRYSSTSTKKTVFAVRAKIADVDKTDLYFGLGIKETPQINIAASALDITDGIGFWKAATATAINFSVFKDSTASTVASGTTLADAGTYAYAFVIDAGVVYAYEGTTLNNLTLLTTIAAGAANIPNDEDLAVTLTVGAEGTGQPVVTLYDLLFWQER